MSQDGYVKAEVIGRKIDVGEILVAEVDGERAGYLRVEFLWSIQPYVALIRVLEEYLVLPEGALMTASSAPNSSSQAGCWLSSTQGQGVMV